MALTPFPSNRSWVGAAEPVLQHRLSPGLDVRLWSQDRQSRRRGRDQEFDLGEPRTLSGSTPQGSSSTAAVKAGRSGRQSR